MAALLDATPSLGDAAALRARVAEDGYLFFPALLDPARVGAVRGAVLGVIAEHGWVADGSDPSDAEPGESRRPGEAAWWPGYVGVLGLESWNSLAHDPALTQVMRDVLGDDLLVQPMKILRVTWPHNEFPTLPHQDFFFVRGASDVLTAWIPLGDCPARLGGLRVLAGSHAEGLREVRAGQGVGHVHADVDDDDPRWTDPHDYRAGDVLVFHSLTVHRAPENQGEHLRISADFRYQSCADPILAAILFPHEHLRSPVPGWPELTKDWSTTRWVETDHPVRIASWRLDPQHVPASRFSGKGSYES
jgi:hypothetical protein